MVRKRVVKKKTDTPGRNYFIQSLYSNAGQSMVEFLVILPVMLLLIFGAIQFALIFHAKITLNYAAFEGVRAGTLNNAKFDDVKEGFARGLAPLYSFSKGGKDQVGAFQKARAVVFDEFDSQSKLIRIERLSPTDASFADFAPDEQIPNDNLMYRSSDKEKQSKESIQDANLLHLRFTYWYPLYVPFINKLIFNRFICCKSRTDILDDYMQSGKQSSFPASCKWADHEVCLGDEPRIPLTATAIMRMQTPAEKSDGYYFKN